MQILVLRVKKPYQQGQPGDAQRRHRLIKPYLYSFLAAIFVCELLCVILYLTDWNFGFFSLDLRSFPFFDLHTRNLLAIALQVISLLIIFVVTWVISIRIESAIINRPSRKKNKQRQKQTELGLLHPDIQSLREPLRVIYYFFLALVALVFVVYFFVKHAFFAPSTLITFVILFTLMRFWHTLHEKWPGRRNVGTSIADLSRYV